MKDDGDGDPERGGVEDQKNKKKKKKKKKKRRWCYFEAGFFFSFSFYL